MGKWRIAVILALISVAVAGGLFYRIGKNTDKPFSGKGSMQHDPHILKFGHDMPPYSSQNEAALKFAEIVAGKTDGNMKVLVYPAQQLGTDYDMLEAARKGDVDIILTPTAKLSSVLPPFQYVDLPFLFHQKTDLYEILDGKIGQQLLDLLPALELIGVAFWESGFKQFTANKPITRPDDFKGLKIRTMKSRIIIDQYDCLGARGIPIDFHQAYQALKDGVVDGQENPLVSIVNMRFYEQQSHMTISNHSYLGYVCIISKKTYDALPEKYQAVLTDTFKELTGFERQRTGEMEKEFLQTIKDGGTKIHVLTKEEREVFQDQTQHIAEKYSPVIGYDIMYETEKYLQNKYGVAADDDIIIGMDADMTLGSAPSGHAIRRGVELAIDEINHNGGLLGRKLRLVVRDNGGISARGIANINFFNRMHNLVAVMGGLHSPVTLSELDIIHKEKIIYLDPWAAATKIVDNGYHPNYIFRVSVRDEYAGFFLVNYVLQKYHRPALLLENTGWGRSNFQGMTTAMAQKQMKPVAVEWFNWGEKDMSSHLERIDSSDADVILLVANAPEGATIIRNMVSRKRFLPIVSHWGITGGYFWQNVRSYLDKIDLLFLQTFSYLPCQNEKACQLVEKYYATYNLYNPKKIDAPVGVAHAYDLVYLLAEAVKKAGTINRPNVRDALEQISEYQGVLKRYHSPFSPENHDALDQNDFILARYDEHGRIVLYKNRF